MTHTKREAFHYWRGVTKYHKGEEGVIKVKMHYRKGTVKPRKETQYFQLCEVLGYPVKTEVANLFMTYDNILGDWWAYDYDSGLPVDTKNETTKDGFYNYLMEEFSNKDAFLKSFVDLPKMRKILGKKLYPVNKE